ncbi:1-acyl-sn-glycerol-3-phosphate acyltransferase, partial [Lactonifactor longoviformis]
MKRIILMVLYNIILVPYLYIKLCYYASHADKYPEAERYEVLKLIDRRAMKGGRITIDAHGVENLPDKDGFIFFPNHQGLFDVLAILQACPRPFSVVMKKEIQNTPFLKQVFQCMKAYALDRDDVRQSMKVIQQVAAEVKNGRNYLIFAEGTRSRNKNELLEMKGGSFKSATKSQCPIVPVALINSYQAFDTKSIKKLTVQVHFLKPLYYEEYK